MYWYEPIPVKIKSMKMYEFKNYFLHGSASLLFYYKKNINLFIPPA